MYKIKQPVTNPRTGQIGRVVFVSPVNGRIYVEYGRTSESWVSYAPHELGDLFAPVPVDT